MASAIGIDIGGTFIDIVFAGADGIRYCKVPSTPDAPYEGVIAGLRDLIESKALIPSDVKRIIHGSTVATNALLESSWERIGLVTSRGFRDVLEIGRQARPDIYDIFHVRPPAVVPRDLRFEVPERLDAEGNVLVSLDRDAAREVACRLRRADVQAVAVVFLFSYLDPSHEQVMRSILTEELAVPVVISSDVLPEFREYERTSTTVVTAALRPIVGEYVSKLEAGAAALGLPARWQIMQSSGTITSASGAEEQPARILLSGPAGGVEGARSIGERIGFNRLITMDMGGTSTDVALIADGRAGWSTRGSIGGHPIGLPMVDIHTIGAGGGSIAYVDAGGAMRVGPRSAGAMPGPAAYGRGGNLPTVTDAHVVLGRVPSDRAMGGLPPLSMERARMAITRVSSTLNLSVEEAALGILEISEAAMERAIRVISVERGHDPRDFALLAFGGAGPLHAVAVARRLGMSRVVVPQGAGVLSAYGLLTAETGHDHSRSIVRPLHVLSVGTVNDVILDLRQMGEAELRAEGIAQEMTLASASADLRYLGQSHELNVDMGSSTRVTRSTIEELANAFHDAHENHFGHCAPDEPIELVTLRVRVVAPTESLGLGRVPTPADGADMWEERVWFESGGPVCAQCGWRNAVVPGGRLEGPLILLSVESTTVIPEGVEGSVGEHGDIILEIG